MTKTEIWAILHCCDIKLGLSENYYITEAIQAAHPRIPSRNRNATEQRCCIIKIVITKGNTVEEIFRISIDQKHCIRGCQQIIENHLGKKESEQ